VSPALSPIVERLSRLARYPLCPSETPLQALPQLSASTGRRLFVKRDDLTGLAFGGNKVRQAEFLIGAALDSGADTILAGGSFAQSNHARILAAAARAAGLDSVILVRPGSGPASAPRSGNALLTRLLASEVRVVHELAHAPSEDRLQELDYRREIFEREAQRLRSQGRTPYVVLGSSTALGVMGYVAAAIELDAQTRRLGVSFSHVFVTSLGATHAGLELGLRLLGWTHALVGVAYQPVDARRAGSTVEQLALAGAGLLGLEPPESISITTDLDEAGAGYGLPTDRSRAALKRAATSDGLLLDPTYTAKGFAAMLRRIEDDRVPEEATVLFVHTGGMPALFTQSSTELTGQPSPPTGDESP
jgi:1-aminocyclopropane-1-carboxylate deaminase/D-cysteine desulfhydrase-like pyridoxal-dependent ACC family enzyme